MLTRLQVTVLAVGEDGALSGEIKLQGHTSDTNCVVFQSDDVLISAGDDYAVRVWSVHTRECLATALMHTSGIWGMDLSPDGSYLVTASRDRTVRVWSTETYQPISMTKFANEVDSACFSESGMVIACPSNKHVVVIDPPTGEIVRTTSHSLGSDAYGVVARRAAEGACGS